MHRHSENTWNKCELQPATYPRTCSWLRLTFLPAQQEPEAQCSAPQAGQEEELELLECKPEASLEQQVALLQVLGQEPQFCFMVIFPHLQRIF